MRTPRSAGYSPNRIVVTTILVRTIGIAIHRPVLNRPDKSDPQQNNNRQLDTLPHATKARSASPFSLGHCRVLQPLKHFGIRTLIFGNRAEFTDRFSVLPRH